MVGNIILKRGDSLKLNIAYKDSHNIPIDLTGFAIVFKAKDMKGTNIISIDSTTPNVNSKIEFIDRILGLFNILVLNTDNLPLGIFNADIQYIDINGVKQSSKSFGLKIVDKL